MIRRLLPAFLAVPLLLSVARADDTPDLSAIAPQIAKSLVLVEYTYKNENTSQEEFGQGIVLNKDGVILVSGVLIPDTVPQAWVTHLKIRAPGQHFETVPATFLGRTANRLFAFLKPDTAITAEPLDLSKTAPTKLGQTVYSIAMQSKEGDYQPTLAINHVKSLFHTTHHLAGTEMFGLTRSNSPVFDAATGNLVGLTFSGPGNNVVMRLGDEARQVEIKDEAQPGYYITIDDVKASFDEIPTKPFHLTHPWLGVEGLSGVDEDLRKDFKIDQTACVSIGAIIPGGAAEKAGLKAQDVILTINGKEFSDARVPEFAPFHFSGALEKFHVGDKITLGIVRRVDSAAGADNAGHSDIQKKDIELTLGEAPPNGAEMPYTFDSTVGITTRDLVFTDTYTRHLPADQKGVYITLVKQNSPAYISDPRLYASYLITKVNDQEVSNNDQFGKLLKAAESDPTNKQILFLAIKPDGSTSVCRVDLSATVPTQKAPSVGAPDGP